MYVYLKSIFENLNVQFNSAIKLFICGRGYLFLIVTLFNCRRSMYIIMLSLFFLKIKIVEPHGEALGLKKLYQEDLGYEP